MRQRDLMSGFIRLHVLQLASTGPVFGVGLIEKLALHGYVLSPGTLYPILHGLEEEGLLRSRGEVVGKKRRRVYEITDEGYRILILNKVRLWELFKDVFESELSPDTAGHVEKALQNARQACVRVARTKASSGADAAEACGPLKRH